MSSSSPIKTICGYCGTGCGLLVETENNRIIKIRGDKEAPVNKGQTCIKGSFAFEYVHSEKRLTHPMIKKNGVFQRASWDEALKLITEKLGDIKNNYGPDAITMFACARTTNESNFVTQKFMRTAIQSNHIDGCNRT